MAQDHLSYTGTGSEDTIVILKVLTQVLQDSLLAIK